MRSHQAHRKTTHKLDDFEKDGEPSPKKQKIVIPEIMSKHDRDWPMLELPGTNRFLIAFGDDVNRIGSLMAILLSSEIRNMIGPVAIYTGTHGRKDVKNWVDNERDGSLLDSKLLHEFFFGNDSNCCFVDAKGLNYDQFNDMLRNGKTSVFLAYRWSAHDLLQRNFMNSNSLKFAVDFEIPKEPTILEDPSDTVWYKLSGVSRFLAVYKTKIMGGTGIATLLQWDRSLPVTIYHGTHGAKDGFNWMMDKSE